MQDHVAWYFKYEIPDEKQASAEAVCSLAHAQIRIHLQGSETDVYPIEKVEKVEQDQKRKQTSSDTPDGCLLDCTALIGGDVMGHYPPSYCVDGTEAVMRTPNCPDQ
ncbi:hypothetical protein ACFSSF_19345 [Dietzia aerolata]|uniref:hypothetical protein n=1 Tax=Dietzia aerolata TaxID=595984 RepID=UPI003644BAA7